MLRGPRDDQDVIRYENNHRAIVLSLRSYRQAGSGKSADVLVMLLYGYYFGMTRNTSKDPDSPVSRIGIFLRSIVCRTNGNCFN